MAGKVDFGNILAMALELKFFGSFCSQKERAFSGVFWGLGGDGFCWRLCPVLLCRGGGIGDDFSDGFWAFGDDQ